MSGFTSRCVCGKCGRVFDRKFWSHRIDYFWSCANREARNGRICDADHAKNEDLRKAFVIAWNSVVKDRDKLMPTWEKMKKSGNPLQRLRARQMIELTAQGPLTRELHEHTRMVLERVVVHSKRHFTVRFLDGTAKEVCLTE